MEELTVEEYLKHFEIKTYIDTRSEEEIQREYSRMALPPEITEEELEEFFTDKNYWNREYDDVEEEEVHKGETFCQNII